MRRKESMEYESGFIPSPDDIEALFDDIAEVDRTAPVGDDVW
jgi:hypothetical protein